MAAKEKTFDEKVSENRAKGRSLVAQARGILDALDCEINTGDLNGDDGPALCERLKETIHAYMGTNLNDVFKEVRNLYAEKETAAKVKKAEELDELKEKLAAG